MESGQVMQISKFASDTLNSRTNTAINSSGPAEFTRRKNWSQNILEELRDVVHVLSQDLNILFCSPASREFLGYQPGELMGRCFTEFLHVDDVDIFTREFRATQSGASILRVSYRFLRKDGKYTTLETRGHFFKQGFFGSARSVPTEMTKMMDTFLDYKMENEILKKKIALAKAKASKATTKSVIQEPSPQTTETDVSNINEDEEYDDEFEDFFGPNNESVYTQGVLNSYNVNESVALFTGLHFDMGERSRGISLGIPGELFNTLIAPAIGEEGEASNETDKLRTGKKRRNDEETERICSDCGRTDSPEWRKGPRGPKTLCNACGLRWAKQNKAQTTEDMQQ